MFDLIVIVVIAALAFPVLAIIALIKAIGIGDLVRRLELRVATLEHRLTQAGGLPQRDQPVSSPAAAPIEPPPLPHESQVPPPIPPEASLAPTTLTPTAVPVSPALTPSASPQPAIGFEERFGTRWVVWVGGLALALGGVFLVRYTIQQGLIGPGVRIALGGLLAIVLVAVGEWARRNEKLSGLPGLPTANIPSILTAAGTAVAYATVYAAYALYGFLPPPVAFVLLGVVALLTLAAALLHGPALAGLGVLGAFGAPMLVASDKPDYWALYIYIAVVTGASFALARIRLWEWLAISALVFGALWTVPGADLYPVEALGAHVFNAISGFALAATLLVCGLMYGPQATPGRARPPLDPGAVAISSGGGSPCSCEPPRCGRADRFCRAQRRDRGHRLANRSRHHGRAGSRRPRCVGDGRLVGALEYRRIDRTGRPGCADYAGTGELRLRRASFSCRRMGCHVRHSWIFGARAFDARLDSHGVERFRCFCAGSDTRRAVLPHCGLGSIVAVRRLRAASCRYLCDRD